MRLYCIARRETTRIASQGKRRRLVSVNAICWDWDEIRRNTLPHRLCTVDQWVASLTLGKEWHPTSCRSPTGDADRHTHPSLRNFRRARTCGHESRAWGCRKEFQVGPHDAIAPNRAQQMKGHVNAHTRRRRTTHTRLVFERGCCDTFVNDASSLYRCWLPIG